MVDFVQLRQLMKDQLEEDRAVRTVDTDGSTLEDAVTEAAVLLNLPIGRIEYEILERGFPGFLGVGKKDWKISAYGRLGTKKKEKFQVLEEEAEEEVVAPVIVNKHGEVFVNLNDDGASLKVVAPVGNGKPITQADAMIILESKNVTEIDENIVRVVVRDANGVYTRVGSFNRKYTNDCMISVNITEEDMKAFITVQPPGLGGIEPSLETLVNLLKVSRVVFGLKEDVLVEFVDRPTYKVPVLVAEGMAAVNGQSAYIEYLFKTTQSKAKPKTGTDGKVDFKDTNTIQNVVKDQPVGRKVPAQQGTMGRTVVGGYLNAKDGNDIEFPLGENVRVGEDGKTILADIAGQVVIESGRIAVKPVYLVQGNVNIKTGNIMFLGSVIVTGNVEEGFSIKAQENIEIQGIVGKAELQAEGNIIIKKGVSSGTLRAGKSVYARFIENSVIDAGDKVRVMDGIINSQVDAYKRIICHGGKRAQIVGGRFRASEEISAKAIGSATSGTETICEVGIDPKAKKELEELLEQKRVHEKEMEELRLNFQTLNNILQQTQSLPEDKEIYMKEIMERNQILITELKKINENIERIQQIFDQIKSQGRISGADKVYPGVKVIIRDATENVKLEYKGVTFILENGLIKVTNYEAPNEDAMRGPEGYE